MAIFWLTHPPGLPCVLFRKGEYLGGFCKSEDFGVVKRLSETVYDETTGFYGSDIKQGDAPKSSVVAVGKWPKSSSKWLVICFTEKMSTATIIFCSRKLGMVM